jgi:hypothetical protein
MTGVDTLSRGYPRSALRYRPPGGRDTSEQPVPIPRASRARAQQTSLARTTGARPVVDDEGERDEGGPVTPVRGVRGRWGRSGEPAPEQRIRRRHPLFLLGIGMLIALVFWVLGMQVVTWGQAALDTMRYGYPRTFQIDAVVGHQDSASSPSHFLAINLHGHIEVIEWPGGDASHARIYVGPQLFGSGNDQPPVTLRFADANGDGRPDMIIEVQGSQIIWINDQGSFRPLKPGEQYSG